MTWPEYNKYVKCPENNHKWDTDEYEGTNLQAKVWPKAARPNNRKWDTTAAPAT